MLLERDRELHLLADLLAGVDSSGGKVVLLRGEAGIGKSALVREFAQSRAEKVHVHYGTCDDLFIPQPLSPFWDMARVEPSLKGPLQDGDRPRLLETVLDLLSRSLRPTLITIEDTHWADEATLDAIRYLGRRILGTNGLLLLTYRDGEVDYDHPLRVVIGDIPAEAVARIQLGGLSLEAVASIVRHSDLDAAAVLAATKGNPFLVTEMAATADDGVPSSLHDSVLARVRKLSIGAQEMLKTLSVIPEPISRQDVMRFTEADESRLDECQRRGLLDSGVEMIAFRHELTRRVVESALTSSERLANNRKVLGTLPEETHPCLLIHCAVEAGDIDSLLDLAPRSARWAASVGSHVQAVKDFREVEPYLDRFGAETLGPLLDEWAQEEYLVDNVTKAIDLNQAARSHYQARGDHRAESRALTQGAYFHEFAGDRSRAEELARQAVHILGEDPEGMDLASALEVNAYLQWMAGNFKAVPALFDRTLEAAGDDIDDRILIRSLIHMGAAANIADYPKGRDTLDEARERAEAAGQWYEECRALLNHAWTAAESRDLPSASDHVQQAIASAVMHELPFLEGYSTAMYARVLELKGEWTTAEELARELLLGAASITQMVALPILGVIEARRGHQPAKATLAQAWEMSLVADEFQRLGPTAIAVAEHAWIAASDDVPLAEIRSVMEVGLTQGFVWSPGAIAFWLWELGELEEAPAGIAEPYRLIIEGKVAEATAIWKEKGLPYEQALALSHGDHADQLLALEEFESLGAVAVAAKLRKALRDEGVSVPRGKGKRTRGHAAGLTARQAEVLLLLDEGLSNTEIADRLFLSPRTVENHVSAVLSKLHSSTRGEAVSRARSDGLLAP